MKKFTIYYDEKRKTHEIQIIAENLKQAREIFKKKCPKGAICGIVPSGEGAAV